jgi:hypothetical protein
MRALATRSTFLIVLFLGLFTLGARNADDPDLWWHLKTGELITAQKSVPHTDPFSYTRFGQRWVTQEWLSEFGLYELYRVTGFAGLILAFAAILTAAYYLLYLRCGASLYLVGAMVLWGALATRPVWGIRPQVISLLLTSLWLLVLERSERNSRLLWWTLPITVLWVNLHAGFALGLGIFALFLCGSFAEGFFLQSSKVSWRMPLLIFLLDLLLVLLNPNGAGMYSYPVETLRSATMQNYILEWASPNFHSAEYWPFLLLILSTLVVIAQARLPLRFRDLLLLLVSLLAGLNSIRMIPFFVLIAVPLISQRLRGWEIKPKQPRTPVKPALNAIIIVVMAVFATVHISQVIRHQPLVETEKFPARAVAFLLEHPPGGHIFNAYDWGGYLIWNLSPTVRVFIDGRADVYSEQVFHDFADAYQLRDGWQHILQRWHVQTIIVPSNSALAIGLQANRAWLVAYHDDQATVLTSEDKSAPANSLTLPSQK